MLQINCKTKNCIIADSIGAAAFAITDKKLYVPAVFLSAQGNTKLIEQSNLGSKQIIN